MLGDLATLEDLALVEVVSENQVLVLEEVVLEDQVLVLEEVAADVVREEMSIQPSFQ